MLSVISVTYNNFNGLVETYNSFNDLNYVEKELIIIDGNSNDGTKEFLNNIEQTNIKYLSEKDEGIYDAMNKGIKLASGDWVIFMNAGDVFYHPNCLTNMSLDVKYDVIYGNCEVNYGNYKRKRQSNTNLNQLWKGMFFSHQTVFVKTSIIKEHLFDLRYRFCADFNQLFQLYQLKYKFFFSDVYFAVVEAGGVSDDKRYLSTNEVFRINRAFNKNPYIYVFFPIKIVVSYFVVKLKKVMPTKLVLFFLKLKYFKK